MKIREGSRIGKGVRVGTDCDLQGLLTIGDHARLHSGVFVPSAHHDRGARMDLSACRAAERPASAVGHLHRGPDYSPSRGDRRRGDDLPGVEIGEGALVAAGSVVREDVAGMVVAGVPARVVGKTKDVECHHGRLASVYPWWSHLRRGYPEGVLPPAGVGPVGDQQPSAQEAERRGHATVPSTTTMRGASSAESRSETTPRAPRGRRRRTTGEGEPARPRGL